MLTVKSIIHETIVDVLLGNDTYEETTRNYIFEVVWLGISLFNFKAFNVVSI